LIGESGNKTAPQGVVPDKERPSLVVPQILDHLVDREAEVPTMTEILLISLAVMAVVVVLGGIVGRLGDLDDVPTMRDMVDRS
jgi:hypothetical protein